VGRLLWLYQASGGQRVFRTLRLNRLLSARYRNLESQTPTACARFSPQLIAPVERPAKVRYRVAVLTGCVQDIVFSDVNRDTVEVLLANDCEVHTPAVQPCCGSLHAHNGETDSARLLARRLIDLIDPSSFDAIISNAAGCGSHLKNYAHLLHDDPDYVDRAHAWDVKLKDIHEWLVEIDFRAPTASCGASNVTYHEACHLCHGQKIMRQPRAVLRAIPGLELNELPESTWCCGSAGIYNITQPEMAAKLQQRKVDNILGTGSDTVATSNPGCHLQLVNGLAAASDHHTVTQPVTLLARAYRAEAPASPLAETDPSIREPR
jgi:glycolate oxidase iron-sulfur subunit